MCVCVFVEVYDFVFFVDEDFCWYVDYVVECIDGVFGVDECGEGCFGGVIEWVCGDFICCVLCDGDDFEVVVF